MTVSPIHTPFFTGGQPMPALDIAPPPWPLRGDGWVALFRLNAAYAARPGIVRPELRDAWQGGVGAVAWMRYHDSPIGPYDELLFIPGLLAVGGRAAFSISQIYVSSEASVVNGRANWGIPKDRADFEITKRSTGEEVLRAGPAAAPFASMIARAGGPRLPLDTRALPLPLAQVWERQIFRISLRLQAGARWLDVIDWRADGDRFPSLAGLRPLAAVKLESFDITFPVPDIEPA